MTQIPPTQMRIAARVRAVIDATPSVTQDDLAEVFGKTQATVSRKLAGQYAFTVTELVDLADMLGVSVLAFLPEKANA